MQDFRISLYCAGSGSRRIETSIYTMEFFL